MDEIQKALHRIGWMHKHRQYANVINAYRISKRHKDISCIVISNRTPKELPTVLYQLHRNRNAEIIFVNNGMTSRMALDHPWIDTYICLSRNTGAYMARNIASIFAHGSRLIFIDDDGIPCNDLIDQHIYTMDRYNTNASMGCCLPLTNTLTNYDSYHYMPSYKECSYFTNLEGNCCIDSNMFYRVDGWEDNVRFGGGGYDITCRMLSVDGDYNKYQYNPKAILYHDYASSMSHITTKRTEQVRQAARRFSRNDNYYNHRDIFQILSSQ